MMAAGIQAWECIVCGYIHEGPEPPDECPLCGAPRSEFKPCQRSAPPEPATGAPDAIRITVLGAGIAGLAAVEAIRSVSSAAEITLISEEPHLPYQRLNLTRYLAGEVSADQLPIHPPGWYDAHHIRLLLGLKVAGIDLSQGRLTLADGRTMAHDKLILATGAAAAVPPIPGATAENVSCLRTRDDANNILKMAKRGSRCVCIGGGILGLEAAGALARRGVQVTLIEGQGWLLSRQLNEKAARMLEKHVTSLGIRLCRGAGVIQIAGEDRAPQVHLRDGTNLPADFVILATGVKPNTDAAQQSGLAVHRGVVVNDLLQTSDPNVLAAGDVAEHRGTVYGLWSASQTQGHIAGLNAIGRQTSFGGMPRSNFLKVLGVNLFSIGVIEPDRAEGRAIEQQTDGNYLRLVFRKDRLVGAILLGDVRSATTVKSAVEQEMDCAEMLKEAPDPANILARLASREGP